MREDLSFLKQIAILATLQQVELEVVVPLLKEQRMEAGEVLFRQGDRGDSLFIVQEGQVVTTVSTEDGEEITVAEFGPGDFFGEMSIFEHAPRSATCSVAEEARVFRLNQEEFSRLLTTQPAVGIKIMHKMLAVIAARLENTSSFLADMVQWGEESRKRAFTDDLTGLYNRRFLDQSLQDQFAGASASGKMLCLIMMDLDHFTDINNEYGHEVGDQLIAAVAPAIKRNFREADILARYGGDEFTFILPDTGPEEAMEICSRLRKDVEQVDFLARQGGTIRSVTTSQGIACYPLHASNMEALREMADQALYIAKERGRNRSEVAPSGDNGGK
jgi:diguanylate cyclase (GGDEF)-like protein